jgi:predicted transcriptional regulator
MTNHKDTLQDSPESEDAKQLVRTSILIEDETDRALRALAKAGERPLSWEIRRALEDHVERQQHLARQLA